MVARRKEEELLEKNGDENAAVDIWGITKRQEKK